MSETPATAATTTESPTRDMTSLLPIFCSARLSITRLKDWLKAARRICETNFAEANWRRAAFRVRLIEFVPLPEDERAASKVLLVGCRMVDLFRKVIGGRIFEI